MKLKNLILAIVTVVILFQFIGCYSTDPSVKDCETSKLEDIRSLRYMPLFNRI